MRKSLDNFCATNLMWLMVSSGEKKIGPCESNRLQLTTPKLWQNLWIYNNSHVNSHPTTEVSNKTDCCPAITEPPHSPKLDE